MSAALLGTTAASAASAGTGAAAAPGTLELFFMSQWGVFGLGGIAVGTIYQAFDGAILYKNLQEELVKVEEEYAEWQERYEALFGEYFNLSNQMSELSTTLFDQTALLYNQTRDIVVELNTKAQIINWLWFGVILIVVFLMIFKRFEVGRFFLNILNYPFLLLYIGIANFFYIFIWRKPL